MEKVSAWVSRKEQYFADALEMAKAAARRQGMRGGAIYNASDAKGVALVVRPIDMGYKEQSRLHRAFYTLTALTSILSISMHKDAPPRANASDLDSPDAFIAQSDEGASITITPYSGGEECGEYDGKDGTVFMFDRDAAGRKPDATYYLQADLQSGGHDYAELTMKLPTPIDGWCVFGADGAQFRLIENDVSGPDVDVDAP